MLDKNALTELFAQNSAQAAIETIENMPCPATLIHSGFEVKNLENLELNRYRFRGVMNTTQIDDFVVYSVGNLSDNPKCFIDAERMKAISVLNFGTVDCAGHADNLAILTLKPTADFNAINEINGEALSQRRLAEWLKDWMHNLSVTDVKEASIGIKQAINTIRKMTVNESRKIEHEASDFSASRSTLENVEVKSKEALPAYFHFKCVPYHGLDERTIDLRLSSFTRDDNLYFRLRIVKFDAEKESIALEFKDKLSAKLADSPIQPLIGTFNA